MYPVAAGLPSVLVLAAAGQLSIWPVEAADDEVAAPSGLEPHSSERAG